MVALQSVGPSQPPSQVRACTKRRQRNKASGWALILRWLRCSARKSALLIKRQGARAVEASSPYRIVGWAVDRQYSRNRDCGWSPRHPSILQASAEAHLPSSPAPSAPILSDPQHLPLAALTPPPHSPHPQQPNACSLWGLQADHKGQQGGTSMATTMVRPGRGRSPLCWGLALLVAGQLAPDHLRHWSGRQYSMGQVGGRPPWLMGHPAVAPPLTVAVLPSRFTYTGRLLRGHSQQRLCLPASWQAPGCRLCWCWGGCWWLPPSQPQVRKGFRER